MASKALAIIAGVGPGTVRPYLDIAPYNVNNKDLTQV